MVVHGLKASVFAVGIAVVAGLAGCQSGGGPRAEVVASHRLPELDGSRLGVTVIRVRYGPGESSAPHTYGCPVVGYIQYGSVRMEVEGAAPAVYRAGETFYGDAGRTRLVSANVSREQPAEFIAWFACEDGVPLALAPAAEVAPAVAR